MRELLTKQALKVQIGDRILLGEGSGRISVKVYKIHYTSRFARFYFTYDNGMADKVTVELTDSVVVL